MPDSIVEIENNFCSGLAEHALKQNRAGHERFTLDEDDIVSPGL
jgi:hypothetical protein